LWVTFGKFASFWFVSFTIVVLLFAFSNSLIRNIWSWLAIFVKLRGFLINFYTYSKRNRYKHPSFWIKPYINDYRLIDIVEIWAFISISIQSLEKPIVCHATVLYNEAGGEIVWDQFKDIIMVYLGLSFLLWSGRRPLQNNVFNDGVIHNRNDQMT
jgi:hypothetical protein